MSNQTQGMKLMSRFHKGMQAVLLALLLAGLSGSASAQTFQWQYTYPQNNTSNEYFSVYQVSAGGYIAGGCARGDGTANGMLITRIHWSGASINWERKFGSHQYDCVHSITQAADGTFYVYGEKYDEGTNTYTATLLKLGPGGGLWFEKQYPSPSGTSYGKRVFIHSTGLYLIGEAHNGASSDLDMRVIKTDMDGNVQWTHFTGNSSPDLLDYEQGAIMLPDESVVIASYNPAWFSNDVITVFRVDSAGNRVFYTQAVTGRPLAIKQTADGGFILAGQIRINNYWSLFMAQMESSGRITWSKNYAANSTYSGATNVFVLADGSYQFIGYRALPNQGRDVWMVRTDTSGNMLSEATFGTPSQDMANASVQTRDGHYMIAGSSTFTVYSTSKYGYLLRVAP
jgi:hypothetical protein